MRSQRSYIRQNSLNVLSLTEQRGGVFAERSGHCRIYRRLAVSCRQLRPGIVSTLVVVVLHVQVDQLGEVDAQGATGVVDVLSIQGLQTEY